MNNCKQIGDLFLDVCDERLDRETDKVFQDHIRSCSHCREEFRWYGLTIESLTSLDKAAPPPDFLAQLHLKLDDVHSCTSAERFSLFSFFRNVFSSTPTLPLPVGVATLAVIAVVGVVLYQSGKSIIPEAGSQVIAETSGIGGSGILGAVGERAGAMHAKAILPQASPSPQFPVYSSNPTRMVTTSAASLDTVSPTIADRIGADNLTVESSSIPAAVESLKRLLPAIRGRIMEERPMRGMNEMLLRVMIPPSAYPDLTSRLVNHGAVEAIEAGAGRVTPPMLSEDGGKNVLLYIRFLRCKPRSNHP